MVAESAFKMFLIFSPLFFINNLIKLLKLLKCVYIIKKYNKHFNEIKCLCCQIVYAKTYMPQIIVFLNQEIMVN